jgi:hypothetical protein
LRLLNLIAGRAKSIDVGRWRRSEIFVFAEAAQRDGGGKTENAGRGGEKEELQTER